jgi:hypothetical protein
VILPGFLCLLFREEGLKMAETAATGGGLKAFQTQAQNLGARLSNMALAAASPTALPTRAFSPRMALPPTPLIFVAVE